MPRVFLGGSTGVIAACLLLGSGCAAAEVYRCVGPNGRTLYGDTPCPKGSAAAREISQQVGACLTEACETKRRAQTEEAQRHLQEQKAELARMQELRIRQEEAWARVLAAQQAAQPAYEPPPEQYVAWGGYYPGWFPYGRFHGRHRPTKCGFDPRCQQAAFQVAKPGHQPRQRFAFEQPRPGMRVAKDR